MNKSPKPHDDGATVAVLLATRDGEAYLDEQLQSLAGQTCPSIDIWASDDGSQDRTPAILESWKARWTKGTFTILEGPQKGFAENFRALIVNGAITAEYIAFCDQDDIWLPDKLERAISWMKEQDADRALLFCSRTVTVSEDGSRIGQSPLFSRPPSFQNAIVQSLAGGNTMVLNRPAHRILAGASRRTGFVSHDWWSYMIVTGVGGIVHYSSLPLVHYRQHADNQIGANASWPARFSRLGRLAEGQFAEWSDVNLSGLDKNRDLLTAYALRSLDLFKAARTGSLWSRMRTLRRSGVYRQTAAGNMLLLGAVALGWL